MTLYIKWEDIYFEIYKPPLPNFIKFYQVFPIYSTYIFWKKYVENPDSISFLPELYKEHTTKSKWQKK